MQQWKEGWRYRKKDQWNLFVVMNLFVLMNLLVAINACMNGNKRKQTQMKRRRSKWIDKQIPDEKMDLRTHVLLDETYIYHTQQHYATLPRSSTIYCTMLYCTALHYTIPDYAEQRCTLLLRFRLHEVTTPCTTSRHIASHIVSKPCQTEDRTERTQQLYFAAVFFCQRL